jgi:RNA polymerase sigma-70 factor (ECF subfamily)
MDNISFEAIKKGDEKVYQFVFNELYEDLCKYAFLYVNDESTSKELIQILFIKLWEKRQTINITTSLKSYLFRAARNACLNHIRDYKVIERLDDVCFELENDMLQEMSDFESLDKILVQQKIDEAIESLPPKCKEIFLLSRKNELTYTQIANELDITRKTVENQMGIALKKLRDKLSPILFLFVWYF